MSCNSKILMIGRPSKGQYDSLCGNGGIKTNTGGCGGTAVCGYFNPHDRTLSPRKHREKVRENIKDAVLLMLGAPVVKIELDDQNIDFAIDYALKVIEDYAPREYFDYYTFLSQPGKSVYKLKDDIGLVRNVFYKEQNTLSFQASDLDGAIPLEYFYPGTAASGMQAALNPVVPIWGKMGEWVLYKQYEQMYSRLSSNIGGWEWVSDLGYIKLYPTPCRTQKIIVHYVQKCKDWKEMTQAMVDGALAITMIMLGNVRGKYPNPPGPGGGTQLDGEYMRTKGWELKKEWEEALITRYGEPGFITMD